jgi:hypothetical protein
VQSPEGFLAGIHGGHLVADPRKRAFQKPPGRKLVIGDQYSTHKVQSTLLRSRSRCPAQHYHGELIGASRNHGQSPEFFFLAGV